MNLSERKKKVLSAVIDENAKTGEPVSSKQLQNKHFKNVSSATIRNELATLEELGLLCHPHTSSGRLPTTDGIKFYINEILTSISGKKIKSVIKEFDHNLSNLADGLKSTAKAISQATNYTAVVYMGLAEVALINKVKLMKINEELALAAILTDKGVLEDVIVTNLTQQELDKSAEMLTQIFEGKSLKQIEAGDFLITEEMARFKVMFDLVINLIIKKSQMSEAIAIEGKDKLFNSQENLDSGFAKSALEVFDEPDKLYPLLSANNQDISVEISAEDGPIKNCAIVTASYSADGKVVGKAGVVGPVRMDYKKVIEILAGISRELSVSQNKDKEKEEIK